MRYPVVIHKDEDSAYGVTVPDLPGCFSAGETLEEALSSSQEAILSHIEALLMDGEAVPKQRPLKVHQENEDYADSVWALVDEAAKREGETRSGFLVRAALGYVGEG